ncbi:MAG TPA: TetR/AcrR family transcriptional regulator [Acidimicrobiia bacterium]|jgi:AcrR family transcriptional regulator|nr:TetR/AcrR family transcriptional regulator [Acidimicrobiia bacterium]
MVTTRNTREDVVRAAGRLFADRGYHGTSMRDLGKELGMLGSSLYAHVDSKQDLLVEVVEEGARLFEASARRALDTPGSASDRLQALIAGHVDVVVENIEVSRTFLNEARMLDDEHRSRVLDARDHYEDAFRSVIREGRDDGSFSSAVDPKTTSIFILSILNAIERWYRPDGELDRDGLVGELYRFLLGAIK